MKITRSRDGVRRTTLRIDVRLGRDEFIDALCLAAVKGRIPDAITVLDESDLDLLPGRMSRAAILDAIKSTIAQLGYDAKNWWTDDVDGIEDELRTWAEGLISNHFPEFDR